MAFGIFIFALKRNPLAVICIEAFSSSPPQPAKNHLRFINIRMRERKKYSNGYFQVREVLLSADIAHHCLPDTAVTTCTHTVLLATWHKLEFCPRIDWGTVIMSCTVGHPPSTHIWLWKEDKAPGVANLHNAMEHTSALLVSSHQHLFWKYQLTALLFYSVTFQSKREIMQPSGERATRVTTPWVSPGGKCNTLL